MLAVHDGGACGEAATCSQLEEVRRNPPDAGEMTPGRHRSAEGTAHFRGSETGGGEGVLMGTWAHV